MKQTPFIPKGADSTELRTTGVDLGGLMTVLGRHLYSTPTVALRELVQNAHDSIIRRRLEQPEYTETGKIHVYGNLEKATITITDTGAGLTDEEVHNFLATVGVGYTRTLREEDDNTGLIGMFGLGFLSAFVLAKNVLVETVSYQTPDKGWLYQSYDGQQYTLRPARATTVGTKVTLELHESFSHMAAERVIHNVLNHYCSLLREPIYIGEDTTPLNPTQPPWRVTIPNEFPAATRKRRLEFVSRFEPRFEPVCTMPVEPDPTARITSEVKIGCDAQGLLYVQDGSTYGTSDNRNLAVFVRGMLLDDNARDLLPPWAGFIGGVIESNMLTPTASREDLQKDQTYSNVQHALNEALINGLADIAKTQPETWRRVLMRHNEALLGATLCDDRLFDLLAHEVRIPSSQGDLPAKSLLGSNGTVHVMLGGQGSFEEMLFRALRVPVARGDRYAVIPFLRKWVATHGGKVVEIGTEQGNKQLFVPVALEEETVSWLTTALGSNSGDEQLVPARFAPNELPLILVPDREAELKRRLESDEADKRMSVAALSLARQFTARIDDTTTSRLYVNMNNVAIQKLLEVRTTQPEKADAIARFLKSLKNLMGFNVEDTTVDLNQSLNDISLFIAQQLDK